MSSVLGFDFKNIKRDFIEISGLNASALALHVACTIKKDHRIVIVTSDFDGASHLHQDIKSFLSLLGQPELQSKIDYFPGWEQSPYSDIHPSAKNRHKRNLVLHRVLTGSINCLIVDVKSLLQKCPPIDFFKSNTFSISVTDILPRSELLSRLDRAGFSQADPVEDLGSYVFRGGIFDLYSEKPSPYRIEFFDDMVESIKRFDPETQLSSREPLKSLSVFPVKEMILDDSSISSTKSAIKVFCDEYGIHKSSRDRLFEKLDAKILDPTMDYLFPFFHREPTASLLEYLGADWTFFLHDTLSIDGEYDDFSKKIKEEFNEAISSEKIIAPIDSLFMNDVSFSKIRNNPSTVKFNRILVGVDLTERAEEEEQQKPSNQFAIHTNPNTDITSFETMVEKVSVLMDSGFSISLIASTVSQAERIKFLLDQRNIPSKLSNTLEFEEKSFIHILEGSLSAGFRSPQDKIALITDAEIFGPKKNTLHKNKEPGKLSEAAESFIGSLEDLEPNEFVVHTKHGIGRYKGLVTLDIDKVKQEFLLLEYQGNDKLYLPVYRLDLVQKYAASESAVAESLDKLGSANFEKTKQKVKAALQDLAHKLLELYAKRSSRKGHTFNAPGDAYKEFEAKFPYAETPDQLKAIEDVISDMSSDKIMDRLICGDVGYGKTEVAMRAAFLAVADGKQVAVLVPTTVLAFQHERSFNERFKNSSYPFKIASLSRFKSSKEIKQSLAEIKEGRVDIVIGTHRLLSKDLVFKDLGLLIVDEEQRFGVEHKERLKALAINTDVLTLTATPIPRTLHLSLMGLRDISVINTAPVDRLSIRTYISKFSDEVIKSSIQQEIKRGGQVFFIHNRVQTIEAMADRLKTIVPEAKIIVAHGQLDEKALEERMIDFYNKKADVLLCSTIIESGLDIPSANTMIINRADMFGLAQLYQLRGRVGRSQARAYCYLLLPEEGQITEDAKKRLEIIQKFVELGSGFKIASHDLELRGGGDILGKSQSGHIEAVGFELYMELLEETIHEMRGEPVQDHFDPEIKLPVPALIPEDFIPETHQRLGFYKKLSQTLDADSLHLAELELQDRYGKPPEEVQNLFWLIRLKQILRKHHIKLLIAGKDKSSLDASIAKGLSPDKIISLAKRSPNLYALTPDSKITIKKPFVSAQQTFHELDSLFRQVAEQ